MDVRDSVALITGGANGIGECCAKALARAGARVAVCDIAAEEVERVVAEIRDAGGEAVGIAGDVVREEDQARFVAETLKAFGRLNIVIPSAGIIRDGTIVTTDRASGKVVRKMSLAQWRQVIDVNLTGTFLTVRETIEAMVNGGFPGVICLISSINKEGQVGQLNYSATKAAIALMPKILVGEFMLRRIRSIRVVGIAPGYVNTAILKGMNPEALAAILKDVHVGRLVEPEEIAACILHCIENEAINATTIEVTGGLTYARSRAK
jgi:3-oxoacyl-[acyl-carrier protein] reductase